MPKVLTKKAAKDYPDAGIKKGESYYSWSMKVPSGGGWYSAKRRSKTYPSRSQLTTSAFLGAVYAAQDSIDAADDPDVLRAVAEEIRDLGTEQEEKFENMPEGLQQGSTGQLLEERRDGCESWADEIEQAADDWEHAISDYEDAMATERGEDEDEPDEVDPADFKGDCGGPF
jgi:hypothetical protein